MWLITALLVGLAGSIHCIGMCGPIALALPGSNHTGFNLFAGRALYNLGRIITYALIGMVAGFIGKGLYLAGAQQWVSIITGVLLILSLLIPYSLSRHLQAAGFLLRFNNFLKNKLGEQLGKKGKSSLLLIGLLNGFLPCGLVYVALAGALNTGNTLNAAVYMALFGAGTFPVMFTVSIFGKLVSVTTRRKAARLIPVFIFFLGVLFILRGMNLGIKFISPDLKHKPVMEMMN